MAWNMWEALPTLYWRVKVNGKWIYERANFIEVDRYEFVDGDVSAIVKLFWPEIPEGEGADESEH